jgi:lipopolysaccharide heptosyltransferase II
MKATSSDWTAAKNILCVRLDALGDVLMTTPALTALKGSVPGRRLTLLTSTAGGAISPLLPMIDETIIYDAPWMKATTPRADGSLDRLMVNRLRDQNFDAAVVFTVYSQNPLPAALFCHLADIPRRLAHARENPYQLLTDWIPEAEPQQIVRHEVQRQLDLVAAVGAIATDVRLQIAIPANTRWRMTERLIDAGIDLERPWIVVHPGASALSRRYPPEHFAEVVRALYIEQECQLVLTGSRDERLLAESILDAAAIPAVCLAGKTTLEELASVLELAPLLISNNTGPVHLAAAVGTPVVDLYALTNMQHTPWRVPHELLYHDVPCKNCYKSICPEGHHDCLRQVTPQRVVAAACRLMQPRAQRQPCMALS